MASQDDLFHPVVELPEPVRAARYARLVGLDPIKTRLRKEAQLLADPRLLGRWAVEHHGGDVAAVALFEDRAPLFVFTGDVGAGKTALAESFGCDLAETLGVPVELYRLKLSTRGSGLVGEMTSLIGEAFALLADRGRRSRTARGISRVLILVVDEADALAQSREAAQMHHEDRAGVDALLAGVDALLAGVDGLGGAHVPVLVVLCTNRGGALDPAVLRRTAGVFTFGRPTHDQRVEVLARSLAGLGFDPPSITALAEATGPSPEKPGYTYSDLTQRLVPAAVLAAFPDRPVDFPLLQEVLTQVGATPVFREDGQ